MSVLVFAESHDGNFKKPALEAVYYGTQVSKSLNTNCIALVLGATDKAATLGKYGAAKVVHIKEDSVHNFDSQVYASVIEQVAKSVDASVIILSHSSNGKALEGRLAVKFNAASVAGANALPNTKDGFTVTKSVYSGKAIVTYDLTTPMKIISVMGNSLAPQIVGDDCPVETLSVNIPTSKIKVKEVKVVSGQIPLPEADKVVSAGRGLKGPENWAIIEDLATALGATTACSRPVADADWRPHHEHVGQTGIAIRPNLYIAIGISGAIQHLAGVNNSKVIVVINKDSEAPFFKAADYGVVGDLFEIVPKLTEAVKKFKAQH